MRNAQREGFCLEAEHIYIITYIYIVNTWTGYIKRCVTLKKAFWMFDILMSDQFMSVT